MPMFWSRWLGRAGGQETTKKSPTYPMFCRLLYFGCFIATILHVVCARNHLEMSLYVLSDGRCITTPPRTVQMHKGLTDKVRIVTEDLGLFEHIHLRVMTRLLRLYAEKEEWLWIEVRTLCNAFEDAEQQSSHALALENEARNQFLLANAPKLPLPPPPSMTLTPLLVSGPSENRVDLVFFGDGCRCPVLKLVFFLSPCFSDTAEEESKFVADATRLAYDIAANQTFTTVKPLLNIWAAFSPSQDVSLPFCEARNNDGCSRRAASVPRIDQSSKYQ